MFKICRENKFSPINTGGVRLFYIIHQPKNHKKFALPFFSLYFCTRKACKTPPKLHKRKPKTTRYHSEGIPISFRRITAPSKHAFTRATMNTNLPSSTHNWLQTRKRLVYMHLVCTTLLRQVRRRLGRKNENFLIFILFFARLALTLHPETQRTDLAACNLSKIMLKLNVVHCAAK